MRKSLLLLIVLSATPSSAKQQIPSCNDESVRQTLINRHFIRPKAQVLSNVLIAGLMATPDNQSPAAWKTNWSAQLKNVRQQRLDVENSKRLCIAEILSTGGPDIDSQVANKLGVPLCVDHLIEYEIQITEDTQEAYISSKCGAPAAAEAE